MDINNKKNQNEKKENNSFERPRDVDVLAKNVGGWWNKTFVVINKTQIKTWHGIFIIAFITGAIAAVIWLVSVDRQTSSDAAGETATLSLQSNKTTVQKDETFTMDVKINTNNNSVVVVKAIVEYNPQNFQLTGINTLSGVFGIDRCPSGQDPTVLCAIVDETVSGKVAFTLAKPTSGINTSSGTVATLSFKALQAVSPSTDNITFNYTNSTTTASYTDSDVILDNGTGDDILAGVNNLRIAVGDSGNTCASHQYSDWGICSSGIQSRTLISSSPSGCSGGEPVAALTQNCYQSASACSSFEYSAWDTCQANQTQTRTITASLPTGCEGGSPELIQSCSLAKLKVSASKITKKSKTAVKITTEKNAIITLSVNGSVVGTYKASKKGKLKKSVSLIEGDNQVEVEVVAGEKSNAVVKNIRRK